MFDLQGNELKEGDEVTIRAKVTKVTENSRNVTLQTLDPEGKEGIHTTFCIRADSIQQAK